MDLRFNRNPLVLAGQVEQPDQSVIRNTLGLLNASVEDAIRYGGELTRAALDAMALRNDRRHVVVDTKVHMLMPGMCPAIPGWHTDGAPRGQRLYRHSSTGGSKYAAQPALYSPVGPNKPDLAAQDYPDARAPRYHLLVTGCCRTEFIAERSISFCIPGDPWPSLYAHLTREVEASRIAGYASACEVPSCTVVEFDWWDIHRGVPASVAEWRFLIRVTETDYLEPELDLRRVIRTQQQVYVPMEFGW